MNLESCFFRSPCFTRGKKKESEKEGESGGQKSRGKRTKGKNGKPNLNFLDRLDYDVMLSSAPVIGFSAQHLLSAKG